MLRANFSIRAMFSKTILAVFGLLTVLSLTGCDEKALVCIGKEEEIQIGNHLTAGALQQFGGESNDIETQTLITKVGKTIADECDRKDMPWEFYYTNSDIPNAMALPGHVFVTKGMTELLKGPDGEVDVDMLAGVLSHEISHVVARHTARLAAERRFADLVEAGLDLLTKRDVTAAESAQFIRQFLLLGYNRNLEEEADRLGATYASRAGYARDGLLRAGERLLQRESRYPDTTAWYLRTHPEWRQRVRVLEQQLAALDDEAVNKVAYEVNDKCSGWWGLVNLGVQYVRAKYILKSGAEIALVDSTGLGYPDTVIRSNGTQKTYYGIAKGEKGLWQVATRVGPNGKPLYTDVVGYSPQKAQELRQKAASLLAKGQTQLAIKELNRAIELGASDAETRLRLARAYQKAGNVAGAKSAYRSVLRGEWEGQASEQATSVLADQSVGTNQPPTQSKQPGSASNIGKPRRGRKSLPAEGKEARVDREMSQAEKEFEKFNREVEGAETNSKSPRSRLGSSNVGREITLDDLEDEVWKKLKITPNEDGDHWKQTWSNAQAILQEMKRQITAGRVVIAQIVVPEFKQVRVTDPNQLVLVEEYQMEGEVIKDRTGNDGTILGTSTLSVIDASHLRYRGTIAAESEDRYVILTKTGPGTFTAQFAIPNKVPWNPTCEASSVDISIQLGNGRIEERVVVKCKEQKDFDARIYDGRINSIGTFLYALIRIRDQSN